MSSPPALDTLPVELQEQILQSAIPTHPSGQDLCILASVSVSLRCIMLSILQRLGRALRKKYWALEDQLHAIWMAVAAEEKFDEKSKVMTPYGPLQRIVDEVKGERKMVDPVVRCLEKVWICSLRL
jgi:hypothetical protein